ncbi:MAG TPA: type II toxin-antitoxin system VapC family toxin [Thermomicrobiales bacterium]|nr:type II toxin-antitoxin system VapC family toxin [Thermomicrobiales bacterium]
MTRPLLFDTTVLIAALRDEDRLAVLRRLVAVRSCYLTAVTVAELQAGARSRAQAAAVAGLTAVFARFERLLAPSVAEWEAAGRLIARARWRRGAMEPRDHYPDVLIAQVAARLGATIVTANLADFRSWIALGKLDAAVREGRD